MWCPIGQVVSPSVVGNLHLQQGRNGQPKRVHTHSSGMGRSSKRAGRETSAGHVLSHGVHRTTHRSTHRSTPCHPATVQLTSPCSARSSRRHPHTPAFQLCASSQENVGTVILGVPHLETKLPIFGGLRWFFQGFYFAISHWKSSGRAVPSDLGTSFTS